MATKKTNTLIAPYMANEQEKSDGITKQLDAERQKTLKIQKRLENMSG